MKIKDVITEANWKQTAANAFRKATAGASLGGVGRALARHYGGEENYQATKDWWKNKQIQAMGSGTPAPTSQPASTGAAAPSPTAAQLGAQQQQGEWINTANGVQIAPATAQHPTIARYNKQVYSLTDAGTWIDVRDKPIGTTLATILNKALEQT